MVRVAILGCGKLGREIARKIKEGKAGDCEVVGVFSRTQERTETLAAEIGCAACASLDEMLALKPAYVVEAATAAAVKEYAVACLEAGVNWIALSTGALNDDAFYQAVETAARNNGCQFYAAAGVIGGLDLAAMGLVAGEVKGTLTKIHVTPSRIGLADVDEGTTREIYEKYPAHMNISVTAGLACGGLDATKACLEPALPDGPSGIRLELEGAFGSARVECYRAPTPGMPAMAAWSAVATLKRAISPIVI